MGVSPRPNGLPLTLASVGLTLQVTAGYWDVYSHRVFFLVRDPWWNPAHFALYAGGFLLLLGVLVWWRRLREGLPRLPGYAWIAAGAILQVGAAISNEAWHALVGEDPPLAPPHVLVVVGMIVASFGLLTALATWRTEEDPRDPDSRSWLRLIDALLILAFTAMWLTVIGSLLFVGAVDPTGGLAYPAALLISGAAPVVAVAALRTFRRFGLLSLLGGALAGINWLLLVGYVGVEPYVPVSILPFVLVDIVHRLGSPRLGNWGTALVAGGLFGFLHNVTFFPFLLGVAWPQAPDLTTVGVTLAGLVGGLAGHALFERTASWVRGVYRPLPSGR